MNICFSAEKNRLKKALLSTSHGLHEVFDNIPDKIDIFVLNDEFCNDIYLNKHIDTCIFPSDRVFKLPEFKYVNSAVSCGMSSLDSVTFSSISHDSAVVCVRRRLILPSLVLEPCEFKAPFQTEMGIYRNLVFSLIDKILGECNGIV